MATTVLRPDERQLMTTASVLLPSVNLQADIEHPDRLSHFRPTAHSLKIIHAVLNGEPSRAVMVVSAYGSGKSLAAAVGAMLVNGGSHAKPALVEIIKRLRKINADDAERFESRLSQDAL